MSDYIEVFLIYDTPEKALEAAKTLGFIGDDATNLPSDGWYKHEDGQEYYYALDVVFGTGTIYDDEGKAIPGFHINGRWRGPKEKLPDFGEALVMPSKPTCMFA